MSEGVENIDVPTPVGIISGSANLSGTSVIVRGVRVSGAVIVSGTVTAKNSGQALLLGGGSGDFVHVHEGALATLTHTEHEHHDGNKFILNGVDIAVGKGSGDEYVLIGYAPWSGDLALTAELTVDDVALSAVYENPTVTNSGSAVFAYNANRNSTNSSYMTWYGGAKVTSGTGTRLKISRLGAAGGPFTFGGTTELKGHALLLKHSGCYAFVVYVDNDNTGVAINISYLENL